MKKFTLEQAREELIGDVLDTQKAIKKIEASIKKHGVVEWNYGWQETPVKFVVYLSGAAHIEMRYFRFDKVMIRVFYAYQKWSTVNIELSRETGNIIFDYRFGDNAYYSTCTNIISVMLEIYETLKLDRFNKGGEFATKFVNSGHIKKAKATAIIEKAKAETADKLKLECIKSVYDFTTIVGPHLIGVQLNQYTNLRSIEGPIGKLIVEIEEKYNIAIKVASYQNSWVIDFSYGGGHWNNQPKMSVSFKKSKEGKRYKAIYRFNGFKENYYTSEEPGLFIALENRFKETEKRLNDKEVQKENLEIKVAELNNELNKLDKDKRVGYGKLYTWDIKIDRNILDLLVNEIITVEELAELAEIAKKVK